MKPLLLLDIDGVISLFGFGRDAHPPGRFLLVDGIPHYLSATAGTHLRRLAPVFETVWCSGWEEKAGEYLPSALELPDPPPDHLSFGEEPAGRGAHWKLGAIERHAGGERPLAWVDDAHTSACHDWARRRRAPTLLLTTQAAEGLSETHVRRLLAWAADLPPAERSGQAPSRDGERDADQQRNRRPGRDGPVAAGKGQDAVQERGGDAQAEPDRHQGTRPRDGVAQVDGEADRHQGDRSPVDGVTPLQGRHGEDHSAGGDERDPGAEAGTVHAAERSAAVLRRPDEP